MALHHVMRGLATVRRFALYIVMMATTSPVNHLISTFAADEEIAGYHIAKSQIAHVRQIVI